MVAINTFKYINYSFNNNLVSICKNVLYCLHVCVHFFSIQSQTIMEPTNTIYLSNDFQINQQPFSPVQFQPIYSEVTDPCLNTNFYNDQVPILIIIHYFLTLLFLFYVYIVMDGQSSHGFESSIGLICNFFKLIICQPKK